MAASGLAADFGDWQDEDQGQMSRISILLVELENIQTRGDRASHTSESVFLAACSGPPATGICTCSWNSLLLRSSQSSVKS